MRSMNATLPSEMPTNIEIGQRINSYQTVQSSEDVHVNTEETMMTRLKSPFVMRVAGALTVVFAFMLLLVAKSGPPAQRGANAGAEGVAMESVNDAVWMAGSTVGTTYCKTSCTSQCSSYFSVYGPLCCDWAEGSEGTKFCAQSVTKEGKCECGVSAGGSSARPGAPPAADKPKPAHPAPAPHDDGGFHPFPTMAWMPWDDDSKKGGGGGGGWEPFKPFKPIKVPEHSVPCKAHCENACGYSNGMCCDYSASGNCDMTEIDGKCYCGTD